jgi:hypothetical protein
MVELLGYLEANGFSNYIASGGSRDFMRPISQEGYGTPRERVIGSASTLEYVGPAASVTWSVEEKATPPPGGGTTTTPPGGGTGVGTARVVVAAHRRLLRRRGSAPGRSLRSGAGCVAHDGAERPANRCVV